MRYYRFLRCQEIIIGLLTLLMKVIKPGSFWKGDLDSAFPLPFSRQSRIRRTSVSQKPIFSQYRISCQHFRIPLPDLVASKSGIESRTLFRSNPGSRQYPSRSCKYAYATLVRAPKSKLRSRDMTKMKKTKWIKATTSLVPTEL